jgi:hypothetical protein
MVVGCPQPPAGRDILFPPFSHCISPDFPTVMQRLCKRREFSFRWITRTNREYTHILSYPALLPEQTPKGKGYII